MPASFVKLVQCSILVKLLFVSYYTTKQKHFTAFMQKFYRLLIVQQAKESLFYRRAIKEKAAYIRIKCTFFKLLEYFKHDMQQTIKQKERISMQKSRCYDNRELSWLKFNERVLEEAGNPRVPLAERLGFAAIYQTNLDEFYMVRVGTLMDQMNSGTEVRENKTNRTSKEQIAAILKRTRQLDRKKEKIYEQIMGELEPEGIRLINFNKLSKKEGILLEQYFNEEIAPFLSPMIVGRQQPFPFLRGKEIYVVVLLSARRKKSKIGIIPCSNTVFCRLIEIPTRPGSFMLSEELILHFAPKMFKRYQVLEKSLLRVTRNADMDSAAIYDEDLDYRAAMENLLKQRKRLSPVRLELSRQINQRLTAQLCQALHVSGGHVFTVRMPLDLSFAFQLQSYLRGRGREGLFYEKRIPQQTPELSRREPVLAQIEKNDVLLSYPFESIRPFLTLLHEAASDESVVSIKMTLYRLAAHSKVVEALIEAAENGKEVVVLLELRARFDEENNIEWSKILEDCGCHVVYGLESYKVHSKLCLITRKTPEGLSYITQIGTGNYNEKTAGLYTDLSLMTAHAGIGQEAAQVFNALLMGEIIEETKHLLVAPKCLQNKVLHMIEEEIRLAKKGEEAYIGLKMNSLTDKVIIEKLIKASKAGVKIEMIIRGICCLVSGVKGETENVTVVSVVGRFLEHSRIYRFGLGERERIYISSADFMTRNTVRRVEIGVPVYNNQVKKRLCHIFDTAMADNEKGKWQNNSGIYENRRPEEGSMSGEKEVNSQEIFYQEAYDRALERV